MNKNLEQLRSTGQSLWLDNITRTLLDDGTLKGYIDDFGITGLTSNPTIFDKAIGGGDVYDDAIATKAAAGLAGEELFIELALEDLRRAAELFLPVHTSTHGVDGWVSMELSPLLSYDSEASVLAARRIHEQANCDNLYIKIPGTPEGVTAIEESIYHGVPVNVTLLFSADQYAAAAEGYLRGIERRLDEGLDPKVSSVASLFVSRWDKAIMGSAPAMLHNELGIAVARQVYRAYVELLASDRWRKLEAKGAVPQRLLWASTGTKDPKASDILYLSALAAPNTVNTIPEETLHLFADHGEVETLLDPDDDAIDAMDPFEKAGIDTAALALKLQKDGAQSFVDSWNQLLERVRSKAEALA